MTDTQRHSFDLTRAAEHYRLALLRIVATLFAMAGPDDGAATLPRHLRNHLLRILRPAESAARRLIVIAARSVEVKLRLASPLRERSGVRRSATGIVYPPGYRPQGEARNPAPGNLSLPLLDPLKRFDLTPRRRYAKTFPRITCIGLSTPTPIPDNWIPSPDDQLDAQPLRRRLAALKTALEDIDRQAHRFARWRARRDAGRLKRFSPLRPGWPPGHRKRPFHEIDDILRECHSLAHYALKSPDTS